MFWVVFSRTANRVFLQKYHDRLPLLLTREIEFRQSQMCQMFSMCEYFGDMVLKKQFGMINQKDLEISHFIRNEIRMDLFIEARAQRK